MYICGFLSILWLGLLAYLKPTLWDKSPEFFEHRSYLVLKLETTFLKWPHTTSTKTESYILLFFRKKQITECNFLLEPFDSVLRHELCIQIVWVLLQLFSNAFQTAPKKLIGLLFREMNFSSSKVLQQLRRIVKAQFFMSPRFLLKVDHDETSGCWQWAFIE